MPDQTFEMKFGQLAENQLNESIPALIPYKIGFQIIDKNDEDTRAIGVMGFIINNVWAYMPVFFIEGRLKGMNSLYLHKQDLFIPAKDNWIAILKDKGEKVLGSVANPKGTRDDQTMDEAYAPADIDIDESEGSMFKYASANDVASIGTIRRMFRDKKFEIDLNLMSNAEKLHKNAHIILGKALKNTDFANNILEFYPEATTGILTKLAADEMLIDVPVEPKEDKLTIIQNIEDPAAAQLSNTEKSALLRNGVYIVDTRDEKSKVYRGATQFNLTNPTESGMYEVLTGDGMLENAGVIFASDLHSGENNGVGKATFVITEDSNIAGMVPSSALFVRENKTDTLEDLVKGFKKLTKASLLGAESPTKHGNLEYVLAIVPGQTDAYALCVNTNNLKIRTSFGSDDMNLVFTDKPGKITKYGNTVFIPDNAVYTNFMPRPDSECSEHLAGRLGNSNTVYGRLLKSASSGLKEISIKVANSLVDVVYNGKASGLQKRADALISLVKDHGIDAGQAQQFLNIAKASKTGRHDILIKHAAAYDPEIGSSINAKKDKSTQKETTIRGKEWNIQEVVTSANKAAQSGIKEVFSVQILKSLASMADISELNRDYVKQMTQTLDKLGRTLFIYYWYTDKMKEKYGEADMQKLEDSLKQVFSQLGDLVLFLKEKSIYDSDISADIKGSLAEDIGSAKE